MDTPWPCAGCTVPQLMATRPTSLVDGKGNLPGEFCDSPWRLPLANLCTGISTESVRCSDQRSGGMAEDFPEQPPRAGRRGTRVKLFDEPR